MLLKSATTLTTRHVAIIVAVFLVWRSVLFGLGYMADAVLPYAPSFPYAEAILPASNTPRWFYSWANFDGVHYITIAEKGYLGTGLIQAFFPVYPYVILRSLFLVSGGTMNVLVVGMIVSNLATVVAMVVWFGFLLQEFGEKKAWIGLAVFLLFPTALFWGAMYTESLFFAAVIGAFWAARSGKWGVAMACAIIATGTRVVGAFLIPALLIELWLQWREQSPKFSSFLTQLKTFVSHRWLTVLLICCGSLGLLGYMLYLQIVFHDPLYFLHVQSEFGAGRQESFIIYPQVVWRSIKILLTFRPFGLRYYTVVLEFLAGTLGLLGVIWGYRTIRSSYMVFALGAFFLPTVTGTFSSMPRYILVCFPLYLVLIELATKRKWLGYAIGSVFWLSLCLNVMLFVQGYWLS